MDLWDLTRLLYRRWYVALPMLLVSVAGVLVMSQSVKPDYNASGHMVLIPPRGPAQTAPGAEPAKIRNPWNDLGFEALGQAAIIKVHDKKVLDGLKAEGLTPNITVTIDYRTPVFAIEAVGNSPEQATGTVRQVMQLLDKEVLTAQKQYAVAEQDLITTLALDQGDQVTAVTSKVKRVLIVAVGIGLLVTAAATIVVDALLRRRAGRLEGGTEPRTTGRPSEQHGSPASGRRQTADAAGDGTARTAQGRDAPLLPAPTTKVRGRPDDVADGASAGGNGAGNSPGGGRNPGNAVRDRVALKFEHALRDGGESRLESGRAPFERDDHPDVSAVSPESTVILPWAGETGRELERAPSERDDHPDVSAVSPESTVILPLSRGHWAPRDDRGKRP